MKSQGKKTLKSPKLTGQFLQVPNPDTRSASITSENSLGSISSETSDISHGNLDSRSRGASLSRSEYDDGSFSGSKQQLEKVRPASGICFFQKEASNYSKKELTAISLKKLQDIFGPRWDDQRLGTRGLNVCRAKTKTLLALQNVTDLLKYIDRYTPIMEVSCPRSQHKNGQETKGYLTYITMESVAAAIYATFFILPLYKSELQSQGQPVAFKYLEWNPQNRKDKERDRGATNKSLHQFVHHQFQLANLTEQQHYQLSHFLLAQMEVARYWQRQVAQFFQQQLPQMAQVFQQQSSQFWQQQEKQLAQFWQDLPDQINQIDMFSQNQKHQIDFFWQQHYTPMYQQQLQPIAPVHVMHPPCEAVPFLSTHPIDYDYPPPCVPHVPVPHMPPVYYPEPLNTQPIYTPQYIVVQTPGVTTVTTLSYPVAQHPITQTF